MNPSSHAQVVAQIRAGRECASRLLDAEALTEADVASLLLGASLGHLSGTLRDALTFLVEWSQRPAVARAYEVLATSHPVLVSFFERIRAAAGSSLQRVLEHTLALLAPEQIVSLAREGVVEAVRASFAPAPHTQRIGRDLGLVDLPAPHGGSWFDQLGGFVPAGYDLSQASADAALVRAANERLYAPGGAPVLREEESGAVSAALRLAGFLRAEALANPASDENPTALLDSELHLAAMRRLPPVLRLTLVRPHSAARETFSQLLAGTARQPLAVRG